MPKTSTKCRLEKKELAAANIRFLMGDGMQHMDQIQHYKPLALGSFVFLLSHFCLQLIPRDLVIIASSLFDPDKIAKVSQLEFG